MVGQLEPHRRPGVCIALIGFLPLFAGIMMVAVANSEGNKSNKHLKGLGPACVTIGSATILGGFLLQFVRHKMWKAKLQEKKQEKKEKAYSVEQDDQTNQPGTSGISNDHSSNNSRPIKIVARSSIEEHFDDIHEMKETWEEEESNDGVEQTVVEEVTPVKTLEDELKQMEREKRAYENPAMVIKKCSEAPLPGSMQELEDSD